MPRNHNTPNFHQHYDVMDRDKALEYAEAANQVGGVAVRAINNEGELYSAPYGTFRVPEGKIRISVSGHPDAVGRMHRQRDANSAEREAA